MSEQQVQSLTTVTPTITGKEFKNTINDLIEFVGKQLHEAKDIRNGDHGDYGIIPGTKKKTLLKPGAEKLLKLFGLVPTYEKLKEVEDFDKGFVFYKYRCVLTHFATGKFAGDSVRSSNNKEKQFIVQSKSAYDLANNVEAKAQKRALVAAVVQATMASEIFDADMSEDEEKAPDRTVTKEEDPHRIRVINRLYGTATQHGWTDTWIHTAIKKKWEIESVTNLSNVQIEELTEFILTKYTEVAKGEKPVLREAEGKKETVAAKEEKIEDAEIVEAVKYNCQGKLHDPKKRPETTFENPWCSKACEDGYYDSVKKTGNAAFEKFMEEQKLKKQQEQMAVGI